MRPCHILAPLHYNTCRTIVAIFCALLLSTALSLSQLANGFYEGREQHPNPKRGDVSRSKNIIEVRADSLFLSKAHLRKTRRGWVSMDADAVVFYYLGLIHRSDSNCSVLLMLNNCDYCGTRTYTDSLSGYHYPIWDTTLYQLYPERSSNKEGFVMGGVHYRRMKTTPPVYYSDARFYYDENNIRREDPQGQYALISEAIREFHASDTVQLYCPEGDTLFICTQRYRARYGKPDFLLETLDPKGFLLTDVKRQCIIATRDSLSSIAERRQRPLRFMDIDAIHDRKKSAVITINYRLLLPKGIKHFKGGQHHCVLYFIKEDDRYVVDNAFFEGWERVER